MRKLGYGRESCFFFLFHSGCDLVQIALTVFLSLYPHTQEGKFFLPIPSVCPVIYSSSLGLFLQARLQRGCVEFEEKHLLFSFSLLTLGIAFLLFASKDLGISFLSFFFLFPIKKNIWGP